MRATAGFICIHALPTHFRPPCCPSVQLEEYDQTCLADVQRFDDGRSLSGYDFAADGFPPPGQRRPLHNAQEHACTARPAPFSGAAAPGPSGSAADAAAGPGLAVGSGEQQAAGGCSVAGQPREALAAATAAQQGPGACLDSPASCSLDAASLTRLAYRFRRIALLHKFGLSALGAAQQRQEWEVRHARRRACVGTHIGVPRASLCCA